MIFSLKSKFRINITLGIVIAVLCSTSFSYVMIRKHLLASEGARLENVASEALERMSYLLLSRQHELHLLAATEVYRSSFEYDIYDQAREHLASFAAAFPMYHRLHLKNAKDQIVASSTPEKPAAIAASYQTLGKGQILLGKPYLAGEAVPVIDVTAPVYLNEFQAGVLVGEYRLQELYDSLDTMRINENQQEEVAHFMAFDQGGVVIYAPSFERVTGKVILQEKLTGLGMKGVELAIGGRSGNHLGRTEHGGESVVGYAPGKGAASGYSMIALHEVGNVLAPLRNLTGWLVILSCLLIGLGVIAAVVTATATATPIQRVVHGLRSAVLNLGELCGILSATSKAEAEGVAQQAAALEEVAATVTEAAATVLQNARQAGEARQVVQETNANITLANQAIAKLTATMERISKESASTASIVRTIDGIAFQTNLLALNASVEAARAGESGAGFAVVADEVRNLALRTTNSAKETGEMIEKTLAEINQGSALVTEASALFAAVVASSAKVGQFVEGIVAASSEQNKALAQISGAVSEIEQVAQQNSTMAGESAAESERLALLNQEILALVGSLEAVVQGENKGGAHRSPANNTRRQLPPHRG